MFDTPRFRTLQPYIRKMPKEQRREVTDGGGGGVTLLILDRKQNNTYTITVVA